MSRTCRPLNLRIHQDRSFFRESTFGDGNCFFHTIAKCLGGSTYEDGMQVKRKIFESDESYRKFMKKRGFEDLAPSLNHVRKDGTFADDFTISYSAYRIDFSIIILVSSKEGYLYNFKKTVRDKKPVLMIAWINRCHFEPIGEEIQDGPDRFIFDKSDPVIQGLLKRISNQGCE